MALPPDLQRLIWQTQPFINIESKGEAAVATWLRYNAPSVRDARDVYRDPHLNTTETLLKAAAWSGITGYTNQLFLPRPTALLLAALAGNVPAFIDLFRRGVRHDLVGIAILRHARISLSNAEMMLQYFFTDLDANKIDVIPLVDEVLLGRIDLTVELCQLLTTQVDINARLYKFLQGYLFGLGYRPAPIGVKEFAVLTGYLLTGRRDLIQSPELDVEQVAIAFALLNPVDAAAPHDNGEIALQNLADHMIAKLPDSTTRQFPRLNPYIRDYAIMRERAVRLLPLIKKKYQASAARNDFIRLLQLLINPDLVDPLLSQPYYKRYLLFLGRFDLVGKAMSETDRVAAFLPQVSRDDDKVIASSDKMARPLYFIDFVARDSRYINHVHLAFENAVMQGSLAEVSARYFTTVPYLVRLSAEISEFGYETLEGFRARYYDEISRIGDQNKLRFEWQNSFLLQWLSQTLTFTNVGNVMQPDGEHPFEHVELDLVCNGHALWGAATAYEYATWQQIWPTLPFRNFRK